ncbi:endothelin-converting enzyme homolog [Dermacentor andersoni]|uniref:endothelin-converting enzyme homolog n=1 Tax=Dermacentor andersoni TaxID=34620 RepID=UPI002417997A|nr:endothelin-converting enzyme homolog [Dermacentor andersoni]
MGPDDRVDKDNVRRRSGDHGLQHAKKNKSPESKLSHARHPSSPILLLEKDDASWATLFCALFLCVIVVAAMAVLITRHLASRHASDEGVCATEDCIRHGRLLLDRLNLSANPCSSFYQYVCANVAFDTAEEKVRRMYGQQVKDFMEQRETLIKKDKDTSHDYDVKASRALDLCLGRPDTMNPTPFVQFMRERGLTWPMKPKPPERRTNQSGKIFT